ncbi:MAG: hypothetical protein FD166_373 [Bacteroidetes bacterium]|nr:MAG: hypothetical protein FD166_373 [Bacteroidota bacterium]
MSRQFRSFSPEKIGNKHQLLVIILKMTKLETSIFQYSDFDYFSPSLKTPLSNSDKSTIILFVPFA